MNMFFTTIWKSIYGPDFYASHRERTLGNAWGYFTALCAGLALLATVAFSVLLVPQLNDFLARTPGYVLEAYPDELVLTFENGVARSNVAEPYYVPYPSSWKLVSAQEKERMPQYLAIIETGKPISEARLFAPDAASAVVRLYADGIIIVDENGGYRAQPFTEMTGNTTPLGVFVLSETQVKVFLDAARGYFGYVAPIVVAMIFVALLFFYGFVLVWVAFVALFIVLLGKLLKKGWTYAESYKLGLYSATLPLLLFSALPPVAAFLGAMGFSALMLGVLIVNFGSDRKQSEHTPATPASIPGESSERE